MTSVSSSVNLNFMLLVLSLFYIPFVFTANGAEPVANSSKDIQSGDLKATPVPAHQAEGAAQISSEESSVKKPRKSKVRAPREKEAEGTQAPNRFDQDVIFKSKYELDGKSLEVDTD